MMTTPTLREAAQAALDYLMTPNSKLLPAGTLYKVSDELRAATAAQPAPDANRLLMMFDLYAANLLNGANAQACTVRDEFRHAIRDGAAPIAQQAPVAAPKGMALVPKAMTQAMRDVTDSEDWTWEDLLAAAEAITEAEYEAIAAAPIAQQAAPAQPQEPIGVEAVAEVINTNEGPILRWLIEGGICDIPEGVVLLISHRPITGDDGSGEVYTAPQAAPMLADIVAKLQDPVLVHAAMLRGEIAKPALRDMLHAYGGDVLAQWDAKAAQAQQPLTDEQCEAIIASADGRWVDGEFRIDGKDLMAMLRGISAPVAQGVES
jgi:hypothetical protein